MKTRFLVTLLSATLASWAFAADPLPGTDDSLEPVVPEQGQLEILLAPIALYPDALVALILPAATHPSEVVLAARFLSSGGKEEEIESQAWDDSVKALARFPEVVTFMDENLEWTQDVGDAFVAHPAEVMGSIQSLRARAARNGTLASTPQQEVVYEDDSTIRIIPAEPEIIYVPYYEPSILYPSYAYSYSYFPSSLVWFGMGYGIGSWLSYDCDWGRRTVWVNHHRSHWGSNYDWRRRYRRDWDSHVGGDGWSCWTPSNSYRRSRPRGDHDYARTDVRTTTRARYEADSTRWESRRDSSRTLSTDTRSIRRPETLRTPTRIDRTDSTRTVDNRRDRTMGDRGDRTIDSRRDRTTDGSRDRTVDNRNDRRPSDNLPRYTDRAPAETVSTTRPGNSTPDVRRRNDSPTRRNPEATQRRPDAVDRRPDVVRAAPDRRESPRPVASPTVDRPQPQPARTITSGAQLRHPQPSSPPPAREVRYSAPSPSPARQPSYSAPSPAPARQPSYSAPSPAPARQPSYSAPRSDPPRSESPRSYPSSANSARHRQVDTDQN